MKKELQNLVRLDLGYKTVYNDTNIDLRLLKSTYVGLRQSLNSFFLSQCRDSELLNMGLPQFYLAEGWGKEITVF